MLGGIVFMNITNIYEYNCSVGMKGDRASG